MHGHDDESCGDIDPILMANLQDLMLQLKDEARIELLNKMFDGYCKLCGRELNARRQCFCYRDD